MAEPVIAQKTPFFEDVEEGKTYWWCKCGRSKTQPWCDGSHAGTEFEPVEFVGPKTGRVLICGCKRSKGPICDGAHNKLS